MTNADDSKLLREISETVNRMDTKLFDDQTGFVITTQRSISSQHGRISRLEKWAWTLTGGGLVVMYLIGHHLWSLSGK